MNAEVFIKSQTDKMIDRLKQQLLEHGIEMSSQYEEGFRAGTSFGISLSSLLLSSIPEDVTLNQNQEDNP